MKSIEFQNNLGDWEAFLVHSMYKTEEGRKRGREILLYVQISFFVVSFILYGFSRNPWIGTGWLIFFEAVFLLQSRLKPIYWLTQRDIQRQLKSFASNGLASFSSQKTIEFSTDTLTLRTCDEVHSFSWQKVNKVEKTDDHIFIFNDKKTVWIVPKRVFEVPAEFENFYNLIQGYTKEVKAISKE